MNYPCGYTEMSEKEFAYHELVYEYMQLGYKEDEAKRKAYDELNK